jgi:hypothetical protein
MLLPANKKPTFSYRTVKPAGWSNKLSKLSEDDSGHYQDKNKHNDTDDLNQSQDIDYLNTPGIVIPSPADKNFNHVSEENNANVAPLVDEPDTSTSVLSPSIVPTPIENTLVEPALVESTDIPFTPMPSTPVASAPTNPTYSHNHSSGVIDRGRVSSSLSSSSSGNRGGYTYGSSDDDSDSD